MLVTLISAPDPLLENAQIVAKGVPPAPMVMSPKAERVIAPALPVAEDAIICPVVMLPAVFRVILPPPNCPLESMLPVTTLPAAVRVTVFPCPLPSALDRISPVVMLPLLLLRATAPP